MNGENRETKIVRVLLEEYKQLYEQFRHFDNIASSKEAIFAVAAFGVLAYTITQNLSLEYTIGAAAVSIALYLFHVLSFHRISFFSHVALAGIEDREKKINGLIPEGPCLNFQTKYKTYEEKVINHIDKEKRHSKGIRIRCMQKIMLVFLVFLWICDIYFIICPASIKKILFLIRKMPCF